MAAKKKPNPFAKMSAAERKDQREDAKEGLPPMKPGSKADRAEGAADAKEKAPPRGTLKNMKADARNGVMTSKRVDAYGSGAAMKAGMAALQASDGPKKKKVPAFLQKKGGKGEY